MKLLLATLLAICSVSSVTYSQTAHEGIALFKNGDFMGAIKQLEGQTSPEALYYLGLSFEQTNQTKNAANAFEESFKKNYEKFDKDLADRFDIRIKTGKKAFAEYLKDLAPSLQLGITSAEKAVQLKAKMAKQNEWLMKANSFVKMLELSKSAEKLFANDEVETDAKVTKVTKAKYTEKARRNNINGSVRVLVILGSEGKVTNVIPIRPLSSGLTEQAVIAAQKIKFTPAIKDGTPVSVAKAFEYNFSIHL